MHAMPAPDLSRMKALVAATTEHVRAELAGLEDAGASFHPKPGEWCAKEVAGHIVEADRRGFAGRVRRILAAAEPQALEAWDQPAVAAARRDCDKPVADLLAEFEATRADSLGVFDELSAGDLDRYGHHPLVGELAIGDVLAEWPFHDRDHLKQMLENTRAWLWPHLGRARLFTELEG